jgi:hypothetical protein
MSDFYNPRRSATWNYGGPKWKLSRSRIDLFLECPRCFYLDSKLGLKRVPGPPFALNSAVDHLLKQEFDVHRLAGTPHPLHTEYGIDARPAQHPKLNDWRENFVGVQYDDPETDMTISGAIDDLWVLPTGEHVVVDYKATAKDAPVTALDQPWHRGYKRQMEVYQWLLRKNGLTVSDTGYFVYCTGTLDRKAFDKRIEFDVVLIPYTGSDAWVPDVLLSVKACLEQSSLPPASTTCDHCAYATVRREHER